MSSPGEAGWLVYACRTPYTAEVAEIIWRRGETVALLVDNLPSPDAAGEDFTSAIGAPVKKPSDVRPAQLELPTVVPLITPGHRYVVEAEARALGLRACPALVDPTAVIARSASIAEGSVVNAAVVIAAGTSLGRFVHVNRSASIGHHNVIEEFATLGPGCTLAGHVRIAAGAFVGAGAICAPKVHVGRNAIVGAGAVVVADVPERAVVVGNPARVIREGGEGYGDVSVPEQLPAAGS